MRVLFNGASPSGPKPGVGHTTANLHRAHATLSERYLWCYPGERVRRLAGRFFKPARGRTGSTSPPKGADPFRR